MKTKFLLVAALVIPMICAQETKQNDAVVRALRPAPSLNDSLQRALYEEEANQDPQAASLLYQDIIRQFDQHRRSAAIAHFRLGECYRKLGKLEEAAAQYDRVLKDYADVEQVAAQAREARSKPQMPQPDNYSFQQRLNTLLAKPATTPSSFDLERENLRRLIQNSPDLLNAPRRDISYGNESLTFLQDAASKGDIEKIEFLLESGARLEQVSTPQKRTALHFAVEEGHKSTVELLLKRGANINTADQAGDTALHLAARKGYVEICKLLLTHKADIEARNRSGGTPLLSAVQGSQLATVELLLRNKAHPNAALNDGRTALFETYDPQILLVLLQHGADPNLAAKNGFTPLYRALGKGELNLAELFLENKADPNASFPEKSGPVSPLSLAVSKNDKTAVQLLLKYNANPNGTTNDLPLVNAINKSNTELAEILLDAGAKPNVQDSSGYTPLSVAVLGKSLEMVNKLIAVGADPNLPNGKGKTPLFLVDPNAPSSAFEIAKALLERGANPNFRDTQNGSTVLDSFTVALSNLSQIDQKARVAQINQLLIAHGATNAMMRGVDPLTGQPKVTTLPVGAGANATKSFPNISLFQLHPVLDSSNPFTVQMELRSKEGVAVEILHVHTLPVLTSADIQTASAAQDPVSKQYEIQIKLTDDGAKKFAGFTEENVGKRLAILLDGKLHSAPKIMQKIPGGALNITGDFTEAQASEIANSLKPPKF